MIFIWLVYTCVFLRIIILGLVLNFCIEKSGYK